MQQNIRTRGVEPRSASRMILYTRGGEACPVHYVRAIHYPTKPSTLSVSWTVPLPVIEQKYARCGVRKTSKMPQKMHSRLQRIVPLMMEGFADGGFREPDITKKPGQRSSETGSRTPDCNAWQIGPRDGVPHTISDPSHSFDARQGRTFLHHPTVTEI